MKEIQDMLIHMLKNQSLLESKILLRKLEDIEDLTDIISDQWMQLGTNVNCESASRIIAFVQSENTVGLSPTLLIQVFKYIY